ncbi:MAG TPA: ABC transporter ATP-binding protein, partial [Planctomycetota bacterium]|nr:ABC transporter ATP-binding protein [Planctomycetota bacterium]
LLLVLGYVAQLYSPIKSMSGKVARLQSNLAGVERAFELLEEPPDVVDRPGARRLARAEGRIEFRDLGFSYGPDRAVLRDVCLEVPGGARVGVVGATGEGKTTLVSLLSRFYDPTEGRILLDGVDLRDIRVADLRDQFAIVLQEPVLFSTSIAENIAYGRPEASRAQIVAAAEAAGAAEFIGRLREGYDTNVGERGMRLSGGERQRIALARAFLKDAPILILDEPTSSVDVGTEAAILKALEGLVRGRTTFLISHRASALELCDVVVRVEDGRAIPVARHGRSSLSHAG